MTGDGFFSVESLRGMWVLLIDDDRSSRELLTDILVTSLGHSPRDAKWLIKEVRARKPEEGGVIPAIVITGEPAAGFEGHLAHPFDPWELCRLITNITNTA